MHDETKNEEHDAPHIEPSEPKNAQTETENESGDPGRTPGKAEGEDDETVN